MSLVFGRRGALTLFVILSFFMFGCAESEETAPVEESQEEESDVEEVPEPLEDECTTDADCTAGLSCIEEGELWVCVCVEAPETCDGVDNDCDGEVDNEATCEGNLQCLDGQCACPAEQTCGEQCVDLLTDSTHCGACGEACPEGQSCEEGMCVCDAPFTLCGTGCVDLLYDLVHCGACDNLCKGGSTCKEGDCVCTGPGEPALCGDACTELLSDAENCGECGTVCPDGATCEAGSCSCAEGLEQCGEVCTDLLVDAGNCGVCGEACQGGAVCIDGSCVLPKSRLLSPLSGKRSTTGTPSFRWEPGPGQTSAVIEICTSPLCDEVLQSAEVGGSEYTVTEPLPVGPVYWRVRSLAGAGAEGINTDPWHLEIAHSTVGVASYWGQVPDFQLDGFADLAVGACGLGGQCSTEAWMYHGPVTAGDAPAQVVEGSDTTLFGYATSAVGDLNGDGRTDLAVGSWLNYSIWVYLADEAGLFQEENALLKASAGVFPMFGHDVAPAGDVNDDGYADLITGDAIESTGYVFFGGPDGIQQEGDLTLYASTGGGIVVAGGCDINRDGRDDVFVGGPPQISIFADPGESAPSQVIEKGGNFGVAVDCAGDTNGDGYLDLIVGAGTPNGTFVYLGGEAGVDVDNEVVLLATQNAGLAVAGLGDINGDGFDDVASSGSGKVHLYYGGEAGPEPTPAQTLSGEFESYGTAILAARDMTGDGWVDLVVGEPDPGNVYLYVGSAEGFGEGLLLSAAPFPGLGGSLGMLLP